MIVPWIVPEDAKLTITSDNDDIEIIPNDMAPISKKNADEDDMVTINPKIIGRRIGAEAIITASANGLKTEAYVKVVSKSARKQSSEKRRRSLSGLFSDIKLNPNLDPKIRTYFDHNTGIISISSNSPSVKKYLGQNDKGQDEPHFQVLVAELVTDAVCRELARQKADKNKLPYLGDDITGAINKEINRLIYEYAHIIHELLVDRHLFGKQTAS